MKWTQLPFGTNMTSSEERIIAATNLLKVILRLRAKDINEQDFVERLHHSRYLLLYPSLADFFSLPLSWECAIKPEMVKKIQNIHAKSIAATAEKVAGILAPVAPDVQELLLQDYAEQLSAWAVGIQNVPLFFRQCF